MTAVKHRTYHTPRFVSNESTGVTLLIRRDIHVAALVPPPADGDGRVVVVDLSIPDILGRLTIVRVIGVYAPTNPLPRGNYSNVSSFWHAVLLHI
jgi:exonuclease III